MADVFLLSLSPPTAPCPPPSRGPCCSYLRLRITNILLAPVLLHELFGSYIRLRITNILLAPILLHELFGSYLRLRISNILLAPVLDHLHELWDPFLPSPPYY